MSTAEEHKQLGNEEFNVKNYDKAIEHYSEVRRRDRRSGRAGTEEGDPL
jgi:hypothetical protein